MNADAPDHADSGSGGDADDSGELELVEVSADGPRDETLDTVTIPESLPILPIRDTVAFPSAVMPVTIARSRSKRVLDLALGGSRMVAAVAQRSPETEDPRLDDLYRIGTACVILKMYKMADGTETIILHGLCRVGIETITREDEYLEATVHPYHDATDADVEIRALMHTVRQSAERILTLSENVPQEAKLVLRGIKVPGGLADFLAANLPLSVVHKQELLETFDLTDRLRKINLAIATQLETLELSKKIQDQVRSQMDQSQREYYLREKMKAIRHELGDTDAGAQMVDKLRERLEKARLPEKIAAEADRELKRLTHIPAASPENSMTQDYLEWLCELPWSVSTKANLDLARAQRILDEDHYGLDQVKRRILEFLAVRTLKPDTRGPILCFAGPPGVGKTSLGQSIARATGRNFVRLSLGGIRDEATIRGHRRTYIGAMPGNIIRELRKCRSNNPLFMLDEVDKIGADVRGDPMSALLEVLDPAQNATFMDHYLNVPFDLSRILFIATANYMEAIEPALRDRMEVIELSSYTHREKLNIARKYLVPRQVLENGLTPQQITIDDEILATIIAFYTREAGVRSLERRIGAVCRARAAKVVRGDKPAVAVCADELVEVLGPKKHRSEVAASEAIPGVVTGLAYTTVGGEILFIEATTMPGSGQLRLTGQLGDVMRESAVAGHSLLRSRADEWGIPRGFFQRVDIHVHMPAGAVPKDGPSAGAAILIAMASAVSTRTVDPLIGMTGEITLAGRVLPIGGVREKVLAAQRAGLKRIILPARNEADLHEVPDDVQDQLEFIFVHTVDDVLEAVFPDVFPNKKRTAASRKSKSAASRRKATSASRKRKRTKAPNKTTTPKKKKRARTVAPRKKATSASRKKKRTAASRAAK